MKCVLLLVSVSLLGADVRPCTKATSDCTETVPIGPGGNFSIVYRNFPLTEPNAAIESALIVIHGSGRNAHSYFASALAGAFLAQALDTTLVVAPRFASAEGSCRDTLAPGEISWTCSGNADWRGGGPATNVDNATSFDLTDRLLKTFAQRRLFPNLKVIVVSGHSAGGQFTHRYAAVNQVEKELGVAVRYVVLNPSSYLYLDDARLAPSAECSLKEGCAGKFITYEEGRNCTTFNDWKYGLLRKTGYAARANDEQIRAQLPARDVTYLLGELDNIAYGGMETSCPAMAQGANRLQRGITYHSYINSKHGGRHKIVIVPACGHNGRCMYTAARSLPLLFPR
jgi:pimeloyl-ACP methyl ester carboxylesterase